MSEIGSEALCGIGGNRGPRDFLKLKPKKSILKTRNSEQDQHMPQTKSSRDIEQKAHFDEMNILATHHPEGKDYGHMKVSFLRN